MLNDPQYWPVNQWGQECCRIGQTPAAPWRRGSDPALCSAIGPDRAWDGHETLRWSADASDGRGHRGQTHTCGLQRQHQHHVSHQEAGEQAPEAERVHRKEVFNHPLKQKVMHLEFSSFQCVIMGSNKEMIKRTEEGRFCFSLNNIIHRENALGKFNIFKSDYT